jgi:membrane protease YdiL (CAAX protease family)
MQRAYLAFEFLLLFIVVPAALARVSGRHRMLLIPLLWLIAGGCLAWLLSDPQFDRRLFWQAPDSGRWLVRGLAIVLPAAGLMALVTWYWTPQLLWALPRRNFWLWVLIMVLYPILSVYPQGIIYRAFFFERYATLFPGRVGLIVASGVAFGFMHVVFRNWVAPLMCLAGGLLFAWVYDASRSLMIAGAVHAALGCVVFTVGLGRYFFLGTQALVARMVEH